jgi:cellulose synthase/poly-beta-1,6-N-acetylglucosamine synthase-like glycosyltransferase
MTNRPVVIKKTKIPATLKGLYFPNRQALKAWSPKRGIRMAAILPTHNPTNETYTFIKQLTVWHPRLLIVVVDDASANTDEVNLVISHIKQLQSTSRVIYLRTPKNLLKAGALNYGLDHINVLKRGPEVIFTLDDDVRVSKDTLRIMAKEILSNDSTGAVCSLALVDNKNKNLLTRLQAFEYHSFNITKIADNEFLHGPLVMQGMLTAFRTEALVSVKGFTNNHLIEDYDITARLKQNGWRVRIAKDAMAWTMVPENLETLWKQRVRWCYGGLHVAKSYWKTPVSIFQDLFGHALFLTMITLVVLSLIHHGGYTENPRIILTLLVLTGASIVVGLLFNVISMFTMPRRDGFDWILKLSIIPEFIYSNILSFVLIGSYLFFIYNSIGKSFIARVRGIALLYSFGLVLFNRIGYSSTWGTKQLSLQKEVI